MMIGMTRRVKIAVSLPEELVAIARRAVEMGRAASVSAYVAEALERRVSREDFLADLDESLERSGGPLTPEEIAWADEILNG
jgi:Arc/MetJ-type ribon-helix-helix transcriptional regulator